MISGLSWNVVDDVRQLLSFHFMLNALRAGTVVAVSAGAVGYFVVLRGQSFAAHTLAVAGFPGAAAATFLGITPAFGYYGLCIAGAIGIAALPGSGRAEVGPGGRGHESALVATIQSFALACGLLFVSLYNGFLDGLNALLFGTIIGITDGQVVTLLAVGAGCLVVLAAVARPLLFASVDPVTSEARGVPVRALGLVFVMVLGVAAAATSQVTGTLLVFALLVAPAATAGRLTARPGVGIALSVAIAVAVVWLGEGIAFFSPYPIGFWTTSIAFTFFLGGCAFRSLADARHRRAVSA